LRCAVISRGPWPRSPGLAAVLRRLQLLSSVLQAGDGALHRRARAISSFLRAGAPNRVLTMHTATFLLLSLALLTNPMATHASSEFTFDVVNQSHARLVRLQASEDGRNWFDFNIGRGIESGHSMTLVWDESTYSSGCEWSLRADFSSRTRSNVARYDFCDPNLEIVFSD
jgi:hypothetical protein